MLRRYKLRGTGPVEAGLPHQDVDSLVVRVVNSDTSDPNFFSDIWLVVTTTERAGRTSKRQYLLNFVNRTIDLPTGASG